MKKYLNIAIVASFIGLWMDSFLSNKYQIILGFLLIFTFGILHGANDLVLIKNMKAKKQSSSWFKILGYYVMVVLIGALLFYTIPQLALLLFILISAYHFGEQQWQNLLEHVAKSFLILFQFFYGFIILLLLFVFHSSEVQSIILNIANINIPSLYFNLLLQYSVIAFIGLSAYLYWKSEKIRKKLLLEFFYLVLFAILFKSSSLIWGFAIYFVLWHSIPSIIDQIKFLNGSFSIKYFIAYCKTAWIYWLISIVGITLIYYICKEEQLFNALFFSFLAAITFPHAVVITNMFGTKQTKNRNA
ncbi:Brp/Blh family beta-carotene 15,15'-dioxygenase [Flavobacterium sp. XS2P24]|uniref:Brp/Blh family beta-carotene 15,15'-dioxygenase n=1 Tax=Flavobacterium sp. XS2P24 TaxID=3041249 RepID=UPI0024A94F7C|nr:Brp/Blh family beta-carotene 15,15'-dioxygenase [Flavobacterium sp. XS2P24]MDI6050027.1 Brp/Blh family beta-carotene 15,15'-dioxygenase [Flavobacterium sp. XS2P24]